MKILYNLHGKICEHMSAQDTVGFHSMVPWSVGDPAVKNVLLGSNTDDMFRAYQNW